MLDLFKVVFGEYQLFNLKPWIVNVADSVRPTRVLGNVYSIRRQVLQDTTFQGMYTNHKITFQNFLTGQPHSHHLPGVQIEYHTYGKDVEK